MKTKYVILIPFEPTRINRLNKELLRDPYTGDVQTTINFLSYFSRGCSTLTTVFGQCRWSSSTLE